MNSFGSSQCSSLSPSRSGAAMPAHGLSSRARSLRDLSFFHWPASATAAVVQTLQTLNAVFDAVSPARLRVERVAQALAVRDGDADPGFVDRRRDVRAVGAVDRDEVQAGAMLGMRAPPLARLGGALLAERDRLRPPPWRSDDALGSEALRVRPGGLLRSRAPVGTVGPYGPRSSQGRLLSMRVPATRPGSAVARGIARRFRGCRRWVKATAVVACRASAAP
jgi:hypothetical protein